MIATDRCLPTGRVTTTEAPASSRRAAWAATASRAQLRSVAGASGVAWARPSEMLLRGGPTPVDACDDRFVAESNLLGTCTTRPGETDVTYFAVPSEARAGFRRKMNTDTARRRRSVNAEVGDVFETETTGRRPRASLGHGSAPTGAVCPSDARGRSLGLRAAGALRPVAL
jgi:hypothetical protein